jgi:hypothetical protein
MMDIQVSEYAKAFQTILVILYPEDNRVETFGRISNEVPTSAYHQRARTLVSYTNNLVEDSVEEYLKDHVDEIKEIAKWYRGSDWDGNNWVGDWADEAEDLLQEFEDAFHWAVQEMEIHGYWDAHEWLFADKSSSMTYALRQDRDKALDDLLAIALSDDVHLRRGDLDRALDDLAAVARGE